MRAAHHARAARPRSSEDRQLGIVADSGRGSACFERALEPVHRPVALAGAQVGAGGDHRGVRRLPERRGVRKLLKKAQRSPGAAMNRKATILGALMSALVFFGLRGGADAQSYPARTVTIVVPSAAGGGIDITARWLAAELQSALGKSFVVENKGGASGIIGTQQVARAEPDGHTLLFTISGFLVTSPALFTSLPWDPVKDFSAVAMVLRSPHVLIVNKDASTSTLSELIELGAPTPDGSPMAAPALPRRPISARNCSGSWPMSK